MAAEYIEPTNLEDIFQAEVRDNVDSLKEGRIKVFIPRLQYDHDYKEKPQTIKTEDDCYSKIINQEDFKQPERIPDNNYIWVRPFTLFERNDPNWKDPNKYPKSGSYKIPRIESIVTVFFIDGDPNKGYYLNNSPTVTDDADPQVIDSDWVINEENWNDPDKKPNIDVIRFYWNKHRIEVDTNENTYRNTSPIGNHVELNDDHIYQYFFENGTYIEITKDYIKLFDGPGRHNITLTHNNIQLKSGNNRSIVTVTNDYNKLEQGQGIITQIGRDVSIEGNLTVTGETRCNVHQCNAHTPI